jgi:hypothetical protein
MMPSLPKHASSVKSTDETRNAQHFTERNTDKSSLTLENQQACDPAFIINGKGKATVHAVPFIWSCVRYLTLPPTCLLPTPGSLSTWFRTHYSISGAQIAPSTETSLNVPGIFEQRWWSTVRHIKMRSESHGRHFGHLL